MALLRCPTSDIFYPGCGQYNGSTDRTVYTTSRTEIGNNGLSVEVQFACMGDPSEFYYEPDESEQLSAAVIEAIAKVHDEDVLEQEWLISEDINTDPLGGLFQERNLKITLQFEADASTATITAGTSGNPIIKIESHR